MNTKITLEEIKNVVESIFPEVQPLIKKVGDNPETGYKEKQACAWQMEFLQQQGFTVQGNLADLSTAFYGEYCVCRTKRTAAFFSMMDRTFHTFAPEYDSL